MLRRIMIASLCVVACQRSDAATTTTTNASAGASSSATPSAVLTPLTSTAPAPSATPAVVLEPLVAPATTTSVHAKARVPSATRDPMKVCCDALRKQSPPQFAQASAVCDGIVRTFDDTGQAPELERLIKPMLLDAPLPPACKGL